MITGKSFVGTTRYASLSAHAGNEQGRKDDLESIMYLIIYLVKGSLPWQSITYLEDDRPFKIGEMKKKITSEQLCENLPHYFVIYLDYIKYLQ